MVKFNGKNLNEVTLEDWLGDFQLGKDIWNNKYRFNGETFPEFLERVSNGDEEIKKLILEKKFMFGGRVLANYNTGLPKASISNCYSSGYVEDSLEGWMDISKNIAMTFKAQGGQGVSLTSVRPKGSPIGKGEYTTDGIVPLMEILNSVTQGVSQGGSRKGALMMSLSGWHKEASTFINIKTKEGKIEGANLPLELDDKFMKIVKEDIINGTETEVNVGARYGEHDIEYVVKPIEIFQEIAKAGYNWGEPGVIYTDQFRNKNVMQYRSDYQVVTGNPCGEQPLPKNGACLLGSINLGAFVINPYTDKAYFDYNAFGYAIGKGIEALDVALDYGLDKHALEEQRYMAENYRNIGLGVMGVGTLFLMMGLKYGSGESLELLDLIGNCLFKNAVINSAELAEKKGSFPKYDERVWDSEIIKEHFNHEEIQLLKSKGLRNCSLLSIAPTGSIGTTLEISTGVEPHYRAEYTRTTKSLHGEDKVYKVAIKELQDYRRVNNTNNIPDYFEGADEINYKRRIDVQAVLQKHIDTAISGTVNLAEDTTVEDIMNLYLYAWEQKLKGLTIFRSNCKRVGILNTSETTESEELARGEWKPIAKDTVYFNRKVYIGCGKLKLMIGWSDKEQRIQDLYVIKSGSGGCTNNLQGMVICMSGMLRLGGEISNIEKAFEGIGSCNSFISKRLKGGKVSTGSSCGGAILNEIKAFLKERNFVGTTVKTVLKKVKSEDEQERGLSVEQKEYLEKKGEQAFIDKYNQCPICCSEIEHTGGCLTCNSCGYSKC